MGSFSVFLFSLTPVLFGAGFIFYPICTATSLFLGIGLIVSLVLRFWVRHVLRRVSSWIPLLRIPLRLLDLFLQFVLTVITLFYFYVLWDNGVDNGIPTFASVSSFVAAFQCVAPSLSFLISLVRPARKAETWRDYSPTATKRTAERARIKAATASSAKQDVPRLDMQKKAVMLPVKSTPPAAGGVVGATIITVTQTSVRDPVALRQAEGALKKIPPIDTAELQSTLAEMKRKFLDELESKIASYVRSTKSRCVAVVEIKTPRPNEVHRPGFCDDWGDLNPFSNVEWIPIFVCFLFRKPYCGHKLESYLSDPIQKLVAEEEKRFREEMGEVCEDYFLQKCANDDVVRDTLAMYIVAKGIKKAAGKTQKEMVKHVSHTLQVVLHSHTAHIVSYKVGHASHLIAAKVSTVLGTKATAVLGKTVGAAFKHQIALHLKVALVHLLQSQAVQSAITHNIGTLVTAAVAQSVIHKVGVSKAAAVFHTIAYPAVGFFLLYKGYTLPRKLGKELGEAVRQAVDGSLPSIPERVLQEAWRDMFDLKNLPSAVAVEFEKSPDFIAAEIDFAGGNDFMDPTHPEIMKDASKVYGATKGLLGQALARRKA